MYREKRPALGILRVEEPHIAAALTDANDDLLVAVAEPGFALSSTLFAADIGFIHFDSTVQHGCIYLTHGATDTVTEIPSGFVGAAKNPAHFVGGESLAPSGKSNR